MSINIFQDVSYPEFVQVIEQAGQPSFRAGQVFDWVYRKGARDFQAMTNLPEGLRSQLERMYRIGLLKAHRDLASTDGTRKFLFGLEDGEQVEAALIPGGKRLTLCLSSQVGCKFGCTFCASGMKGFQRHLRCAEMVEQLRAVNRHLGQKRLTHIVFMGIGEPLDNYDQVLKAVRLINAPQAFHIAARRITISTCGLIPQIRRLKQEGLQIELSVSLHGYDDESRRALMPVSRRYALSDLIAACQDYSRTTKRQITFEYILIKDLTCSRHAAASLARLLKGLLCKINLIPYNKVTESPYDPPARRETLAFRDALVKKGILATIRQPRGQDIGAACGQLRYKGNQR